MNRQTVTFLTKYEWQVASERATNAWHKIPEGDKFTRFDSITMAHRTQQAYTFGRAKISLRILMDAKEMEKKNPRKF